MARSKRSSSVPPDLTTTESIYQKRLKTVNLRIKPTVVKLRQNKPSRVTSDLAAYDVLRAIFATLDDDQEHMVMLVLNQANDVTGFKVISSGTMDASLVDAKVIFRSALLLGGRKILLCHNHPSGNLAPSSEDLMFTEKMVRAGRIMDMEIVDHIVLTAVSCSSIRMSNERLFEDRYALVVDSSQQGMSSH